MKKIRCWYNNLSLRVKIIVLVSLAGLLPVGMVLLISTNEIQKQSYRQQMYALNQSYEQMSQTLEDKMQRLYNISTLLAVNDLISTSLQMGEDNSNLAKQLAYFERIDSYIYEMEMAFEVCNVWFYIDESFSVVNGESGRYRSLESVRQQEWYQQLMVNNGTPTWVSLREENHETLQEYAAVARCLWNQEDYSKSNGILTVSLERRFLDEMMIGVVEGQEIYMETVEGNLLASNMGEDAVTRVPLGQRNFGDKAFHTISLNGENCLVRSQLLDKTNIYLIFVVPENSMMKAVNRANAEIIVWYVLICVMILGFFFPLTKSVTRRMRLLKEQMMLLQAGVFQKITDQDDSSDEIGEIISKYNSMTDKVAELMEEQYAIGQEKIRIELKALQSQINPHFLYNTLDMINWMAQKSETENIRCVIQAMSDFYRLTLSKGQDVVTIGDEIRMCEAYMEIQKRRYRGRILYETEIEEDIKDYLIPKITVQPFLENAIIHGINEKEEPRGVVILSGWREEERIILAITDDGKGIVPQERMQTESGSHYGMKNIEKRLELFYGEKIPIQIESSPGIGTCIIINIPIRK